MWRLLCYTLYKVLIDNFLIITIYATGVNLDYRQFWVKYGWVYKHTD